MKHKKTTSFLFLMSSFLIIVSMFFISSCESSRVGPAIGQPNPPAPPAQALFLQGTVTDDATGSGIAGANVNLTKTGGQAVGNTITNGSGGYSFDLTNVTDVQLIVNATAQGYGFKSAIANVDKTNNLATVAVISLKKITGTTVTATPATGATAQTPSTESASGQQVQLSIPPAAVNTNTNVTVASVPVNNTPATSTPTTQNDVASAVLSPAGITFQKPVSLSFPMPYQLPAGTQVPLAVLTNNTWQPANINAVVDASGFLAVAQVNSTGQYALLDNVGVNQTGSSSVVDDGISVKLIGLKKTMNPLDERMAALSSGTQILALPWSWGYIITIRPTVTVSEVWLLNLISKTYRFTLGSGIVYANLAFPGLPAAYVTNGVQTNPNRPGESGNWEYRYYYISKTITYTVLVSRGTTWTTTWQVTNSFYVLEDGTGGTTDKTGWYWIPHNQGGISFGPF